MAYQVYLTDDINVVEMDTENIDVQSVFALLTLEDIGQRRQNIQNIRFSGTKINNNAFGTFFDLGRTSDFGVPNKLLFNYNPLTVVKILVYENTELIFLGSLRIQEINIDRQNIITYDCVVTTAFIDLKSAIQDRKLEDIDIEDLSHKYCYDNIRNSWNTSIQTFNANAGTFNVVPFELGRGYVYPMIDFGYRFNPAQSPVYFNAKNFRPQLYVKEYMNRIFKDAGFKYEIRADQEFLDDFNRLVLLDGNEELKVLTKNRQSTLGFSSSTINWTWNYNFPNSIYDVPLNRESYFPNQSLGEEIFDLEVFTYNFRNYRALLIRQDIEIDGKCSFNVDITLSIPGVTQPIGSRIVNFILRRWPANDPGNLQIIASRQVNMLPFLNQGQRNFQFDIEFNKQQFKAGDRILVTAYWNHHVFNQLIQCNLTNLTPNACQGLSNYQPFPETDTVRFNNVVLVVPKQSNNFFNLIPKPQQQCNGALTIKPAPPFDIKQIDFLKSIVQQFNFVVYTEKEDSRKIIFQRYDDFYALTQKQLLKSTALDWSSKIDYKTNFKIKSNIQIPKSYLFTYKKDEDFLNADYIRRFNNIYGQLEFDDQYGLTEQKKVELIFSPLIPAEDKTQPNRKLCYNFKDDNGVVKRLKTQPKLGYYNGLQRATKQWVVAFGANDTSIDQSWDTRIDYPQLINYRVDANGVALRNLHFGEPQLVYFENYAPFANLPNSYNLHYINQTTDLTNENVVYVECEALLNSIDIANLNLKVPIFINTGEYNGAYFKLLRVEYQQENLPSKIFLQKIGI